MSVRPPEQGWFEKAEQDLEMARRAMNPAGPLPEMVCYHCQKGAEKYLKGFLVSQEMDFLYVHDLVYLTQQCMERKMAFAEFIQSARILTRYGAGIRYPMDDFVVPDVDEAMIAIKLAEDIATFVRNNL